MNPFTLKELRQLTRSKTIAGTLIGVLAFALLLAYFIPVGKISYNTGHTLFIAITVVLGIMTILVLPVNVFVRMMKERGGKRAADLTLATTLSPASIIDGKLRGAFALIGLSLAAELPFAAFAYLLHGISLAEMAEILLSVGLIAALAVHFALVVASLRLSPAFRWVIFVAALFFGSSPILTGVGVFTLGHAGSSEPFTRGFFIFVAIVISVCLLARAFAISTLTPRPREHDLQLRLTTLFLVVAWGVYVLTWWHEPITDAVSALKAWMSLSITVFIALAIAASAQPGGYSRRQLASYRAMPTWRRVLFWPFMSGAKNGLVFSILGALALSLVLPLLEDKINARYVAEKVLLLRGCDPQAIRTEEYVYAVLVFVLYNSSILLCFRALWRVCVRRWTNLSPVLVIALSLITIAFLQTLPALLGVDGATVPFSYSELKDANVFAVHLQWSVGAFVLALAVNLPALFRHER